MTDQKILSVYIHAYQIIKIQVISIYLNIYHYLLPGTGVKNVNFPIYKWTLANTIYSSYNMPLYM